MKLNYGDVITKLTWWSFFTSMHSYKHFDINTTKEFLDQYVDSFSHFVS